MMLWENKIKYGSNKCEHLSLTCFSSKLLTTNWETSYMKNIPKWYC